MTIIWSEKAVEDFEQNIIFLMDEWNEKVVQDFTDEAERILKIISINPKAFPKHRKMKCHIVPITKHITLFYDVNSKQIQLLRFWNNFRNPRKLSIK